MNITILGCGVFGCALAKTLALNSKNRVVVWNKFESEILKRQEEYLNITFTTDLEIAIKDNDFIIVAIPVSYLEDVIKDLAKVKRITNIIIASKGIDVKNKLFSYEIIMKYFNNINFGVLSGGTFADDMEREKVMGITLASTSRSLKNTFRGSLSSKFLKVQYIDDYIGVSICGAVKNVMAIGFGILDGANYPASSKFLFLTRAIYEIGDLIKALGGNIDTVMSYAGLDDIMMTCTSSSSRNYTLGNMIGKGDNKETIDKYKNATTVEGLGTAYAIYKLANDKDISVPIIEVIYKILYEYLDYNELIILLENEA